MASIVVMRLPAAAETGVMHERTGFPSRWIVHAPHKARPQPNFVPVIPSTSRSTQSNGVSSSTSTLRALPLIVSVCAICRSSRRRRAQNVAPPCRVYVIRFLLCLNRHRYESWSADARMAIDGCSHQRLALLSFPHASHTSSARDVSLLRSGCPALEFHARRQGDARHPRRGEPTHQASGRASGNASFSAQRQRHAADRRGTPAHGTSAGRPQRNQRRSRGDSVKRDRKSTRLNSSHLVISYAVFCLKKKKILTAPLSYV